jgi:hypothetical protein
MKYQIPLVQAFIQAEPNPSYHIQTTHPTILYPQLINTNSFSKYQKKLKRSTEKKFECRIKDSLKDDSDKNSISQSLYYILYFSLIEQKV